jgi:hypothetical protein
VSGERKRERERERERERRVLLLQLHTSCISNSVSEVPWYSKRARTTIPESLRGNTSACEEVKVLPP